MPCSSPPRTPTPMCPSEILSFAPTMRAYDKADVEMAAPPAATMAEVCRNSLRLTFELDSLIVFLLGGSVSAPIDRSTHCRNLQIKIRFHHWRYRRIAGRSCRAGGGQVKIRRLVRDVHEHRIDRNSIGVEGRGIPSS